MKVHLYSRNGHVAQQSCNLHTNRMCTTFWNEIKVSQVVETFDTSFGKFCKIRNKSTLHKPLDKWILLLLLTKTFLSLCEHIGCFFLIFEKQLKRYFPQTCRHWFDTTIRTFKSIKHNKNIVMVRRQVRCGLLTSFWTYRKWDEQQILRVELETTESKLQRQDTALILFLVSVDFWFREQQDPKRQRRLCCYKLSVAPFRPRSTLGKSLTAHSNCSQALRRMRRGFSILCLSSFILQIKLDHKRNCQCVNDEMKGNGFGSNGAPHVCF